MYIYSNSEIIDNNINDKDFNIKISYCKLNDQLCVFQHFVNKFQYLL